MGQGISSTDWGGVGVPSAERVSGTESNWAHSSRAAARMPSMKSPAGRLTMAELGVGMLRLLAGGASGSPVWRRVGAKKPLQGGGGKLGAAGTVRAAVGSTMGAGATGASVDGVVCGISGIPFSYCNCLSLRCRA